VRISPRSQQELADFLKAANSRSERVESVDHSQLSRVVEYTPEDMTATVEVGISLINFQAALQHHNQWLPLDPFSNTVTIRELLDFNLSGPRRLGYGTVRDYLIGIKVALPTGQIIKAGGKVVKNVAGYDLCKLFVGSRQTLGVLLEATFKLRPLPEKEIILELHAQSLEQLSELRKAIVNAPLHPVLFDLHRLGAESSINSTIAFAGPREDVDAQSAIVRTLGFTDSTRLDYEKQFWNTLPAPRTTSVLPSETISTLQKISTPFVCRFGNGIIYHRSEFPPASAGAPKFLSDKLKSVFDPNRILPDFQP
jgi:FAD/FMN-containing dehydrogenase